MPTVILCTDGSDLALQALVSGLALLRPCERNLVVTVIDAPDESLVTGASGLAGGVMSPETFDELESDRNADGRRIVADTAARLGIGGAETRVLHGDAGAALCALATEVRATAIVLGSRGRGGIKRAFLGSVSDFVVRNAPCPVVVARGASTS